MTVPANPTAHLRPSSTTAGVSEQDAETIGAGRPGAVLDGNANATPGAGVPAHRLSPARVPVARGTSAPDATLPASGAASLRPLWTDTARLPRGWGCVTLTPMQEARAAELIGEGWSCGQAADELGVPCVVVAEVAYRRGLVPMPSDVHEGVVNSRRVWRSGGRP